MIPETENYNETVLIPVLQDRVSVLTNQTILLEAKLKIAEKEKAQIQKQLDEALQPKSEPTGEQNPE